MKLIKVFSDNNIDNVFFTILNKFDEVIYIIDNNANKIKINSLKKFLNNRKTIFQFVFIDIENFDSSIFDKFINYSNFIIDYSGGNPVLNLKISHLNLSLNSFYYTNKKIFSINNINNYLWNFDKTFMINTDELIKLSGASIEKHLGHKDFNYNDTEDVNSIKKIINIMHKNYDSWSTFAEVASKLSNNVNENLLCELYFKNDNLLSNKIHKSKKIFTDLQKVNVIESYKEFNGSLFVKFSEKKYIDRFVINGKYLEYDVYLQLLESNLFNSVDMSVVIDWNGDDIETITDPTCEIDVIAINKIVPIFISCKLSKVEQNAVHQIRLLANKFGGKLAQAIVVSLNDNDKTNTTIHKMKGLDTHYFNYKDLVSGQFAKKIYELSNIEEDKNEKL